MLSALIVGRMSLGWGKRHTVIPSNRNLLSLSRGLFFPPLLTGEHSVLNGEKCDVHIEVPKSGVVYLCSNLEIHGKMTDNR